METKQQLFLIEPEFDRKRKKTEPSEYAACDAWLRLRWGAADRLHLPKVPGEKQIRMQTKNRLVPVPCSHRSSGGGVTRPFQASPGGC